MNKRGGVRSGRHCIFPSLSALCPGQSLTDVGLVMGSQIPRPHLSVVWGCAQLFLSGCLGFDPRSLCLHPLTTTCLLTVCIGGLFAHMSVYYIHVVPVRARAVRSLGLELQWSLESLGAGNRT